METTGQASIERNIGLRVTIYSEVDGTTTDLLFQQLPVRIGRNSLNDLVLSHPYVSQWHAVVGLTGEQLSITQVGSSNSVQVGEYRLHPNEEVALTGEPIHILPFTLYVQAIALPGQPEPAVAPDPGVVSPNVGHSDQMMLEQTALKVVDRLSSRFLGRTLDTPEEVGAFGSRLEGTLHIFMRYFVALQKGQEQFRQALDIKALRDRRSAVEDVEDANQLAVLLLSDDRRELLMGLEYALKNIMLHQVALINGLMAGVRSLLARLSPRAIHKEASTEHRSPGVKLLWETYERIHRDLAEEDNETFETIFGPQFGKAYTNLVGKKARK